MKPFCIENETVISHLDNIFGGPIAAPQGLRSSVALLTPIAKYSQGLSSHNERVSPIGP